MEERRDVQSLAHVGQWVSTLFHTYRTTSIEVLRRQKAKWSYAATTPIEILLEMVRVFLQHNQFFGGPEGVLPLSWHSCFARSNGSIEWLKDGSGGGDNCCAVGRTNDETRYTHTLQCRVISGICQVSVPTRVGTNC